MANSEGRALLTIDTLKTFYCCIEKPLCGMNPTHSVPKILRSTKLQLLVHLSLKLEILEIVEGVKVAL